MVHEGVAGIVEGDRLAASDARLVGRLGSERGMRGRADLVIGDARSSAAHGCCL